MIQNPHRKLLQPTRPRIRSRHHVRLQGEIVRERGFKLVGTRILDLSEAGMLIAPTAPIGLDEEVIVSFMAPYSRIWIDAEAAGTGKIDPATAFIAPAILGVAAPVGVPEKVRFRPLNVNQAGSVPVPPILVAV
mgnify:CR=1 FL=1